jgi:hypothetical protein
MRSATPAQKRQIWWLAERVLGPIWRTDADFRHGVVEKATGGRSRGMSELNQWGAQDVFRYLIEYGKNARRDGHPVLASDRQQKKLYKLAYELGLATPAPKGSRQRANTNRLRAWLFRMFKTRKPVMLLYEEADQAIEGLKEMYRRGERYGPKAPTA